MCDVIPAVALRDGHEAMAGSLFKFSRAAVFHLAAAISRGPIAPLFSAGDASRRRSSETGSQAQTATVVRALSLSEKVLRARQMEAMQPCVADNAAVISCASCPLRNNVTVWQCRVALYDRPPSTRDTPS